MDEDKPRRKETKEEEKDGKRWDNARQLREKDRDVELKRNLEREVKSYVENRFIVARVSTLCKRTNVKLQPRVRWNNIIQVEGKIETSSRRKEEISSKGRSRKI